MADITKKDVEHLAGLSRIQIMPGEEQKIQKDLAKILEHFTELNEIDTEGIVPLAGGTLQSDVFREDEAERTTDTGKGKEQFPEIQSGFLKIPQIFSEGGGDEI